MVSKVLEQVNNYLSETGCDRQIEGSMMPMLRRYPNVDKHIAFCRPEDIVAGIFSFSEILLGCETLIVTQDAVTEAIIMEKLTTSLSGSIKSIDRRSGRIVISDGRTSFRVVNVGLDHRYYGSGICGLSPRYFIFVKSIATERGV